MKHGLLRGIATDPSMKAVTIPLVQQTTTLQERMRGLLGRPPLQAGHGLLIIPCNSVHSFCMRYAIDVVYLDRHNTVIRLVRAMRPFRLSMAFGAAAVLELAAHETDRHGIKEGMRLLWEDA